MITFSNNFFSLFHTYAIKLSLVFKQYGIHKSFAMVCDVLLVLLATPNIEYLTVKENEYTCQGNYTENWTIQLTVCLTPINLPKIVW